MKRFDSRYEHKVIDYTELYSWTGQKFKLRETQNNQIITYDGIDVAHPQPKYQGESAVFIIVDNIDILDDYLEGPIWEPFDVPSMIYHIFVVEKTEQAEECQKKVEIVLRKMWRNYGILVARLIFVNEDNVVNYMNHHSLKSWKTNMSDFSSWGVLQKSLVNENLTIQNLRNLNGFPLKVFMFESDPMSISWDRFPKSFRSSGLGNLQKYNPLTAGNNGLTTAGIVEYLNFTPKYIF